MNTWIKYEFILWKLLSFIFNFQHVFFQWSTDITYKIDISIIVIPRHVIKSQIMLILRQVCTDL